ncbi:MAG TPA: dihydropteroate synthase [Chloroflexota bacterium]|nr:dihydropteroate synthase [Chloroflexota bacterium]
MSERAESMPGSALTGWRTGRTLVMGIINLSPDSFSGDGVTDEAGQIVSDLAIDCARAFVANGADILDVGGESTRPGAEPVPVEIEIERVVSVIRSLVDAVPVPVSVDTYKPLVAEQALEAGARIVNDVTGLQGDPAMASVVARYRAGVIAMHMRGRPRTMQIDPRYDDLIGEVRGFLARSVAIGLAAGIPASAIALDPGIGFGKNLQHNLEILRRLPELRVVDHALVVGTSRKSFIGRILGTTPDDRIEGTAVTVALAIAGGADVVRVHDVRAMARVVRVADAIVRGYGD